jgi:1-acyl-sn-glycerol-3-phosphate acyltransferase
MSGIGDLKGVLRKRVAGLDYPDLNEFGQDPFGFEPAFLPEAACYLAYLYKHYFRTVNYGLERLPDGPVMVVSNHTGQIPIDAGMIFMSLLLDKPKPMILRAMVDHFVGGIPFVGNLLDRCGQVAGTPENADYLLSRGQSLLIFPEGTRGINKPFSQAYQVQEFGQGFLRLAVAHKVPIVPVAVVGCEEMLPSAGNIKWLGRMLGLPQLPILMSPLPLPARLHLHWGDPFTFTARPDDDDEVIQPMVHEVRNAITKLLEHGLSTRTGIFD